MPTPGRASGGAAARGRRPRRSRPATPRQHEQRRAAARRARRAGTAVRRPLIGAEPYASEGRRARDRRPSARRRPPPRRRRPSRGRQRGRAGRRTPAAGARRASSHGSREPGRLEDRVEQPGGEAPDQHVGDGERRPDVARRVAAPGTGWPGRSSSASGTRATRATSRGSPTVTSRGSSHQADDGDDEVVRRAEEQLLQGGEHAHAGRVDAGLLLAPRAAPSRSGSRRPGRPARRGRPAARRGCAGARTSR